MQRPSALLLDLDDTLLDGRGLDQALIRTCELVAASREGLEAQRLIQANRRVWADYWPTIEDDWTLGRLDGAAVSIEAWRRTIVACGLIDESLARHAAEVHAEQMRRAYRLHADVPEFLSTLQGRLPLALVTNGASDTQRDRLRWLGLEEVFDAVVVSAEVGAAKPDAEVFRVALQMLGLTPVAAWHVGDSLRTDVAGAKAAGVTAVWLNRVGAQRRPGSSEPDLEVRSLMDLLPLLAPAAD